jgi:DNA-3-methyladenine glycosylase II
MAAVIAAVESVHLDIDGDGFRAVARAIVDQQISVHAARSIWLRFERLLDGDVSAQSVLAADADDMRGCGLSRSKIAAIKDLSQHVIDGHIDFATLEDLPDEEIIEALTQVRGVGRWTAQMYLMFALGRPDVFASADGGLRRAVEQLLGLEPGTPPQAIEAIAEDWAPYRSVAALFLWRSLQ